MANAKFIRHAHAPVKLHGLMRHPNCGLGDERFQPARFGCSLRPATEQMPVKRRLHLFYLRIGIDHPVLDNLEPANRLAKLFARFHIGQSIVEQALGEAAHFCRRHYARRCERLIKTLSRIWQTALNLNLVQSQHCCHAAIDDVIGFDINPHHIALDDEQFGC